MHTYVHASIRTDEGIHSYTHASMHTSGYGLEPRNLANRPPLGVVYVYA